MSKFAAMYFLVADGFGVSSFLLPPISFLFFFSFFANESIADRKRTSKNKIVRQKREKGGLENDTGLPKCRKEQLCAGWWPCWGTQHLWMGHVLLLPMPHRACGCCCCVSLPEPWDGWLLFFIDVFKKCTERKKRISVSYM